MNKKRKQELEKWRSTREKGLARFVLFNGILLYGIPIGILIAFFSIFANQGLEGFSSFYHIAGAVIAGIIIGLVLGSAYGLLLWRKNEKKSGFC